MDLTTTFRTKTGTLWSLAGSALTRVSQGGSQQTYAAVPSAVDEVGRAYVAVKVHGTVTFVDDDDVVHTTGRIAEILRIAYVAAA